MGLVFNTIAWLLFGIILPFFWIKSKIGQSLTFDFTSGNETEGATKRSYLLGENEPLSKRPHITINTLYDVLLYGARVYPASKHLFGTRSVTNIVKESKDVTKSVNGVSITEKKEWSFFELSAYKWVTYRDAVSITTNVGAGLVKIGLKPQDKVTIFASTKKEWLLMAYSCYSQSLVITTAYDNLGVEALIFSLNEGEVTTLFTQGDLFSVVKKIGSQVASLKNIIYCGTVSEKELQDVKSTCGFDFYSMEELEQLGRQNPVPINAAKPEDLCCIMYTSGSTGNPKGVMLTHENMIASITGGVTLLGSLFSSEDVYLGYLPLAHVLEFLIENCCIFKGVAIGYGSPRTLTDQSVRNCKGDIRELRPTVMAGVPMVWETIKKGIVEKLDHVSPSKRSLFYGAIELKKKLLVLGLPTTILDKVIFKKIAEGTGGRLRAAISGGAPIAPETQMFLTCALCPLVQGYGMTETCGMMTVQGMTELCVPNSVGSPSTACEIKLVACNNYNPNGTPPRGEVWVRGRNIMSGYYKQPKITQENITSDGWLMTGDIGEWREDGSLSIIDRKKNLVKLSHGEYVALEKLEAQYKSSKYLINMCIHADPLESKIVAIVVPNPKALTALQKENGIDQSDINNSKILEVIGNDFIDSANSAGFKGAEILKTFRLVEGEWTPENGMLTAAQKIKRKEIVEAYKDQIDSMYGR